VTARGGRPGPAALATAAALVLLLPACAGRRPIAETSDTEAVSVDIGTLWKQEAASDPITAYRIRIASDPDNAGLHNNLGNHYVFENRMDDALREFRTAARLDRRSPIPWNNLGTTYKKLDNLGAALDAFQKAVHIDERYALAYYNIGTVYDQKGDYDNAIEYYLKALALRPELTEVRVNPQVVENKNLMVVKLRHYLEESGNIALPLDRLPE
jgi:tetratricopeptide (TPR) repeat protein